MLYVRQATVKDNATITKLSHQLGYAISEADSLANLEYILNSEIDVVSVAEYNGEIMGWMQLSKLLHIETGLFCEIVGLVVDANMRSKGIGQEMLKYAHEWARQNHCQRLVVRSNVVRSNTHRFYINNGFAEKKEQKVFEMNYVK